MKADSRLKKLLETATHPTATDGERISALNAFRRISERAGGIEQALGEVASLRYREEEERVRGELQALRSENVRLKTECDALLRRNQVLSKPVASSKAVPSGMSENTIFAALSKEWQELHRIHEKAKMAGYLEPSASTLSYLDALCSSGKVTRREPGFYAGPHGKKVQQAQTWRLKAKFSF